MSVIRSEFVNDFGDEWMLEIDRETGVALLSGSDIGDDFRVPVIDGTAVGLALNAAEQDWLEQTWATLAIDPLFGIYRGIDTEFVVGPKHCFLTNDYCPICLRVRKEFDKHHCVWRMEGGADTVSNLLAVCRTCHALITSAAAEDRVPRDMATYFHQLMHFGMRFFIEQMSPKAPRQGREFLNGRTEMLTSLATYQAMSGDEKQTADQAVQHLARVLYQYHRGIAFGIDAYQEHHRREEELAKTSEVSTST